MPRLRIEGWNDSEPLSQLEFGETFDFPKPSELVEGRLQVFVAFDEPAIFDADLVITGHFNMRAVEKVRNVVNRFRNQ